MNTLTIFRPEDVAQAEDPGLAFAHYARQRLGMPGLTLTDVRVFRKKANEFFKENPHCDWFTLCRLIGWCKNHHKRPPKVWSLFALVPYAWADGALPELDGDFVDVGVEEGITDALRQETDPAWRRRLLVAQGQSARAEVLAEWRRERTWEP